MAFVFTTPFVVAAVGLVVAVGRWRRSSGIGRGAAGLGALVAGAALALLLVKFAYEKLYPCLFVDRFYCDFTSTQYWNLLGREAPR